MKKSQLVFLMLSVSTMFIVGCKKDDDKPEDTHDDVHNDGEVITTAILKFTDPMGVAPAVEYQYRDPDGEGGNPAVTFDDIVLQSSTSYNCEIILLNETLNPIDSISNEVLAEAADHLFCYTVTNVAVDITRTDSDSTYEIGLQTLWTTAAVGSGTMRVVLKHQPGIKNGTCDPGDSDIDLTFDLTVE